MQSLVAVRDWDGAVRQAHATLDLAPQYWFALCFGGQAHLASGRLDDAIAMFERGVTSSGEAGYMVGLLGHALARAGRRDEAREQLEWLRDRANSQYVAPLSFALVEAGLDQRDDALDSMARAIDLHDPWVAFFMEICPAFDDLRSDPRFADLRRRVGL